ncbi:MAG: hypothetical protein D3910_10505 [Candidatus Electrothrix sp. ATG2]|nr:hypothetical protein [Candidatus Electrothrix sp. ATG2]
MWQYTQFSITKLDIRSGSTFHPAIISFVFPHPVPPGWENKKWKNETFLNERFHQDNKKKGVT